MIQNTEQFTGGHETQHNEGLDHDQTGQPTIETQGKVESRDAARLIAQRWLQENGHTRAMITQDYPLSRDPRKDMGYYSFDITGLKDRDQTVLNVYEDGTVVDTYAE